MSAPARAATSKFIDVLKTGPKTMQQLYQELPDLAHCTIKKKLVRPLTIAQVTQVIQNKENKSFYIQLRDKMPVRFEDTMNDIERQLQPKKLNMKWNFQDNKRFTKDIGRK